MVGDRQMGTKMGTNSIFISLNVIRKAVLNIREFTNKILLLFVYIFGIGPTSLISKLIGKDFLSMFTKKSAWAKRTGSDDINRMF